MKQLSYLAISIVCLVGAQLLWDDDGVDGYRTEYITETDHVYTTVLGTPVEWTTSFTTVHATPKPTTTIVNSCEDALRACICPESYHCEFESLPSIGQPCPKIVCRPSSINMSCEYSLF